MLSEPQIESLSDLLASMLVAEWKAQHQGSKPQGDLTIESDTYDKSTAYEPDSNDHDPGPTPQATNHGALRLVPGAQKRGPNRRDSFAIGEER